MFHYQSHRAIKSPCSYLRLFFELTAQGFYSRLWKPISLFQVRCSQELYCLVASTKHSVAPFGYIVREVSNKSKLGSFIGECEPRQTAAGAGAGDGNKSCARDFISVMKV